MPEQAPDFLRWMKTIIPDIEDWRSKHPSMWADECLYMLRNSIEHWKMWSDECRWQSLPDPAAGITEPNPAGRASAPLPKTGSEMLWPPL